MPPQPLTSPHVAGDLSTERQATTTNFWIGTVIEALGLRRYIRASVQDFLDECEKRARLLAGMGLGLSGPHVLSKYGAVGLTMTEVIKDAKLRVRSQIRTLIILGKKQFLNLNPLRTYGLTDQTREKALIRDLTCMGIPILEARYCYSQYVLCTIKCIHVRTPHT